MIQKNRQTDRQTVSQTDSPTDMLLLLIANSKFANSKFKSERPTVVTLHYVRLAGTRPHTTAKLNVQ